MPEPEEPPVAPEPETIPRSPNAYVYVDEVTGVVMNTLHTLERGAQVNAIYLASMGKIMPRADWTDDHIREVFDAAVGQRGAIRPVFVEVLE